MNDLINYNDALQQANSLIPQGVKDRAQKVNEVLNQALGIHMLLNHFDFYKNTFGSFGDKLAEKGMDLKNTVNNIITDPSSLLDSEAGMAIKDRISRGAAKVLQKGQDLMKSEPEDIEMQTLASPKAAVDEDVLFPGAQDTSILPLANVFQDQPATASSSLQSISAVSPRQVTESGFKEFTQMRDAPASSQTMSADDLLGEGRDLLSGGKQFLSDVLGRTQAMREKGMSTFKSLSQGDFDQAKSSLQEIVDDPETSDFIDPLKSFAGNIYNNMGEGIQSALSERLGNIPSPMVDYLKSAGMDENSIKMSLMEPDEFSDYLRTIRGIASDKVSEMRGAYVQARQSANESLQNLQQTMSDKQQQIEELGDNMQTRLQTMQENLESQAQFAQEQTDKLASDMSTKFQDVQPKTLTTNSPGEDIASDIGKSAKSDIAEVAEESTAFDEDPIGAGITAILGIGALGDTIYNAIADVKTVPTQMGYQMGV